MPSETLRIQLPDDWHVHLRDGEMLRAVLPYTERQFGRAIVMPNLNPPVLTRADAQAYRSRILSAAQNNLGFEPLMTLYLTQYTDVEDLRQAYLSGDLVAAKLYPAGATTNSDAGVKDIEAIYPILETMQELGMPLLVHGEVVDPEVDIFDREAVFIDTVLQPLCQHFPQLKVVLEHITTKQGVEFVKRSSSNVAATVTPHHLMVNRNAMLAGGIHPHYYCLPILKREEHRLALRRAVTSGDSSFFLGTDSAPHGDGSKHSACGCAGIFNTPRCLEMLAQVFEQEDALDKLEAFCSTNGPAFYGMEPNRGHVILEKSVDEYWVGEEKVQASGETVTAFDPGVPLSLNVIEVNR